MPYKKGKVKPYENTTKKPVGKKKPQRESMVKKKKAK
jgi:hypothetical protein|tara:strand:- start:11 stop:121 length:111 start_codon:yes stop_codon:yes gene_type:complete